jgi:hypothetical protein
MTIQRSPIAFAIFAASISAGYAGPCSQEIATAAVSSARESTAATMHRQPTPHSIATGESELGDLSPEQVTAVTALMARAREADSAGDESACN